MRLTQLEIKGFKSFGDRTVIQFDEGVTAIAGPNGCGKSNVVDAIRWVLGEQSTKNLRSDKMDSVIFNGTSQRKASNLSEVTLTFENTKNLLPTEYNTVSITRKLYRTGESEYRLNDIPCRLKDITNLFLDTGIGSNSYSIIELRMIDELIVDRDNSRRQLFEEAAGISKYKLRKKQTLSKLNDTLADIARVDDLLFEIEKNMKSLEGQAKKAEKYQSFKSELKTLNAQLATFKIKTFSDKLNSIESKEEEILTERSKLSAELDTMEAGIEESRLKVLQEEKNLQVQQKQTNEKIREIQQIENDKKLKNERLNFMKDKQQRLEYELKNDTPSLQEIVSSLERINLDLEKALNSKNDLEKKVTQEQHQLEQEKTKLNTLKSNFNNSQDSINQLKDQIIGLERELDITVVKKESLLKEKDAQQGEQAAKNEELKDFNSKITELEQIANDVQLKLTKQESDFKQTQHQLEQTETALQQHKDKLVSINRKLDAKQNEYNLTKSLVENLEGFPESLKYLKKNSKWVKNAPLLSDIIFCEEDYRVAIENYLDQYMNHFIVATEEDAYQSINLLKEAIKGRAQFFILDKFNQNSFSSKTDLSGMTHPELIPALSVIKCNTEYYQLCNYLLRNVFIATNDEIIKGNDLEDVVVLAKSGRYTKSKHSIGGGSVGLFEGKRIGRSKNLEILAEEIQQLEKESITLRKLEEEAGKEVVYLKAQIEKLNPKDLLQQQFELSTQLSTLTLRKEQHEAFIKTVSSKDTELDARIAELESKLKLGIPQLDEWNKQLRSIRTTFEIDKENIQTQEEHVMGLSNQFNQLNIQFHQQKNTVSSFEKDVDYKQAHKKSVEQRIEKNKLELAEVLKSIEETLTHGDDADEHLKQLYAEKTAMEQALQLDEENFFKRKGSLLEVEKNINEARRKRDQVNEVAEILKDQKNNLKLELNSLKDRLLIEFNIQIEDLFEADLPNDTTEEDLQIKVDRLRNSIEGLGNVNPMAIEAYNEVKERYDFIITQKNDLMSAQASLNDTISEIDEQAKAKFMEAFLMIRENFIKVFRSLFNEGDTCDLYLNDPENPLESSIEIVAKPKGKKPQSINQLSGGEKTLTAISILFSLYLLKPAPFCIFDEVDAPLDDSNIDKFNNIIRKFSKESQFIVVSHIKKTLASSDIIYGVTMVEQGISKLVPVDLRDAVAA
jgi:chromosome segregation protein